MFIANKFSFTYDKYADTFYYQDFKEDSLQIAKYIMLNNHFLGGLYLIYGLYFIQDDPKQTVRLEYREFEKIKEQIKENRKTLLATCEPGYVFAKLLKNEAFSFTYNSREFSMEGHQRARLVHSNRPNVKVRTPINNEEWLNNLLQNYNIADDLRRVDKEYYMRKERLKQEHSELNLNLDLMPKDTLDDLSDFLIEEKSQSSQDLDIGDRRRKMKERPMMKRQKYKYNEIQNVEDCSEKKKSGRPKYKKEKASSSMVNPALYSSNSMDRSDLYESKLDLPHVDCSFSF